MIALYLFEPSSLSQCIETVQTLDGITLEY